jgi:trans-aconitate methyltransferase
MVMYLCSMTIDEATQLISSSNLLPTPSYWADLGCGGGIFSYALAGLLPEGSRITCIDQEPQQIEPSINGVSLRFEKAKIEKMVFAPRSLDGILMANALHYVKDQPGFIERLESFLSPTASFLIVEYDTDLSNRWVPYPISFSRLQHLFKDYSDVKKLGERPSVYGRANLYACQITR